MKFFPVGIYEEKVKPILRINSAPETHGYENSFCLIFLIILQILILIITLANHFLMHLKML